MDNQSETCYDLKLDKVLAQETWRKNRPCESRIR